MSDITDAQMQIYRENTQAHWDYESFTQVAFIRNTDVKGPDELRFGKDLSGDLLFRWELHSYLPAGKEYDGATSQW